MFRCTDCNKKYEINPAFCDCGNNTFTEEISATKTKVETPKKTFLEQYPEIQKFIDSIDILSGIIFISCLILSVLAWNLIGSGTPAPNKPAAPQEQDTPEAQNKNIPEIEQLWNNTPPKPQAVKSEVPILPQQPLPENPIPEQKQETKPLAPIAKPIAKPLPKTTETKPVPVKPKIHHTLLNQDLSSLSPEMKSYTNGLSQTLFSQWAVGSVSGEGLCEVEFSISKSGNLIGRKFSKQSDNNSLNNSVYGMLMRTPKYYPPPNDYQGEKIRISFYFDNGSYEVNYPKY